MEVGQSDERAGSWRRIFINVCRRQRRTYLLVGRKYAKLDYQWLTFGSVSVATIL